MSVILITLQGEPRFCVSTLEAYVPRSFQVRTSAMDKGPNLTGYGTKGTVEPPSNWNLYKQKS